MDGNGIAVTKFSLEITDWRTFLHLFWNADYGIRRFPQCPQSPADFNWEALFPENFFPSIVFFWFHSMEGKSTENTCVRKTWEQFLFCALGKKWALTADPGSCLIEFGKRRWSVTRSHTYFLLQTVTNCLIGGLALADAFVGFVGIPCVIVTLFYLPHNFYGCVLMNCMIIILTQVQTMSVKGTALQVVCKIVNWVLWAAY